MLTLAPFMQQILKEQSVDETTSAAVNCQGYPYLAVYVVGNGVTSSGVITVEESPTSDLAGTWASIGTINASGGSGGAAAALGLTVRAYGYVRARISTVIGGGGTVTVYLAGTPVG